MNKNLLSSIIAQTLVVASTVPTPAVSLDPFGYMPVRRVRTKQQRPARKGSAAITKRREKNKAAAKARKKSRG